MSLTQQLDFAALARISDVGLRARILVHSYFSGMHPSPHYGRNAEFASYAAYRPGDDIKDIDWRAWARSDEYFVKQYDADCTLDCYLVLDTSGSMAHHGENTLKMSLSITLVAALALLMVRQHDACGLLSFANSICNDLPPRSHESQFDRVIYSLANIHTGGNTELSILSPELERRLKRKSLVILISDLHCPQNAITDFFRRITFHGHELICFRPLAEEEISFPHHGNVILVDAETGQRQPAHAQSIRQKYMENLAAHSSFIQNCGMQYGVDVETFTAHDISAKPLAAYLVKRKMMV
jgi:uncharacterized protein (DUF58 family)